MVLEKVKDILSNQFGVDAQSIDMSTRMVEDLGADSLDVVDLLMSIEDEFDIEVPDDDVEKVKCVEDLVKYLEAVLED